MHGFEVGDRRVLSPPVRIEDDTRDRLVRVMAAVSQGATPEDVSEWLEAGFPADVEDQIARPYEADELSAHVDVFLAALQASAVREVV
jgi:hypothetical protein